MEAPAPPVPGPLRLLDRIRCGWAGLRDRRVRELPPDRHTPWTRRRQAEYHQRELAVLAWLVERHRTLARAETLAPRRPASTLTGPPPRHVPEDVWEARKAATVASAQRTAEQEQAALERIATEAQVARVAADAAARVAIDQWAARYTALCNIYHRARTGRCPDISGWHTPGYAHLSSFDQAPRLLEGVNLHRFTETEKEITDVAA